MPPGTSKKQPTRQSQARAGDSDLNMRQRDDLMKRGIDPDTGGPWPPVSGTAEPVPFSSAAPRKAGDLPAGYDNVVIMAVAEAFVNHARKDEIPLAWGVPYLYKMFAPGVAATGLLSGEKVLDGNGKLIDPAEAGIRLVRYFWEKDLWEYECSTGEQVAYRFAEPSNMRSWYISLRRYWYRRRVQKLGTRQAVPELHRNPETPRREQNEHADPRS